MPEREDEYAAWVRKHSWPTGYADRKWAESQKFGFLAGWSARNQKAEAIQCLATAGFGEIPAPQCLAFAHGICGGPLHFRDNYGCGKPFCQSHLTGRGGPYFCLPCWEKRKAEKA